MENMKAAALSDCGSARKINQDAALIKVCRSKTCGEITLMAVADGMGGLSGGEVASSMFIRNLEDWFEMDIQTIIQTAENIEAVFDKVRKRLTDLVYEVNERILVYGKRQGIRLGTTAAVLFVMAGRYMTVHVGDSRIYRIGRMKCVRLTKDHSLVERQVEEGVLTSKEAAASKDNNVLLQCIGAAKEIKPEVTVGRLNEKSTFVACTDGFWKHLDNAEIHHKLCPQMCVSETAMESAIERLVSYDRENGETDNITAVAVMVK
ncbi:MAG: serine/threonine-protein phosphatase [Butyrivibrio sp.]|nr:serine/threonine-protein phosphatase [Butyrivibrio sp.]